MCLITKTRLDSETETLIPTTGGGFDAVGVTIHGTDGTTSVASYTDVSSSLRSRIPSGVENSTTTAVLQPIPYDLYQITAPVNRQNRKPSDPCHTLARDNAAYIPVAIQGTLIGRGENAGPQGSGADVSGAMFTLTKTDVHAVAMPMQVRRLTAEECEKLQGFLPGYTNIPWRGKPESPDGPRYKALGNSMAVPVMRYIGERINKVEAL